MKGCPSGLPRPLATLLGSLVVLLAFVGVSQASVKLTTISRDPYANTDSFHRTEVEPDTFARGSTVVSAFQVGRFSSGGSANLGWATSTNAGATWRHGFLPATTTYAGTPGPFARISDPVVAFDAKASVWMIAGLAIDSSITGRAVLVSRSTDGLHWMRPVTVAIGNASQNLDKEWVVCDNRASSPHYGNCYIEWDDAGNGGQLQMARSSDGGRSWTASTVPTAGVIGGQPLVQANGNVVVPINDIYMNQVESFVSDDGGATYTGPYAVSPISAHLPAGDLRVAPLPSAEVNAAGKVYVAWQDCRFRTSCATDDIVLSTSRNGKVWSPVARIPTSPTTSTRDAFIPGLGVDAGTRGSSTRIGLAYYTYKHANCTASTCEMSARFMSSANGGSTWSNPVTLVRSMSLPWLPLTTLGYMVGDYVSTSWVRGRAFPVVARATAGACSVTTLDSCNESMVTPKAGITPLPGARPLDRRAPARHVTRSRAASRPVPATLR